MFILIPPSSFAAENFSITKSAIESKIAVELQNKGLSDKIKVVILGRPENSFFASERPFDTHIEKIEYDAQTSKFRANVSYFQDGILAKQEEIIGRYESLVEIPVLKARLSKGALISSEDVEYIEFSSSRVRGDIVAEADQIVGKSLKRTVSPKRPIKLDEIVEPVLIKKDDIVTLLYKTDYIEIKATGIALEEGALGSVIQVKNEKSGAIIRGKILSSTTVIANRGEVK